MRKIYTVHNHDRVYYLENGDYPPDDVTGYHQIGKDLGDGKILTEQIYLELEDKYVDLVQDFFAALDKDTFYIAHLEDPRPKEVPADIRDPLARIKKTQKAGKADLDWIVRANLRSYFWCRIVADPVTYFFCLGQFYTEFCFDDEALDFNKLDARGLYAADLTEESIVDTESYPIIDIPPGFFDND